MSILVTGGAGFIGSHTCVELLNAGYEIVVLDNFSNSKPDVIRRIKELTGKDFPVYAVDLLYEPGVQRVFDEQKIDAVIHFAGFKAVGQSVSMPLEYHHNNITGTLILCRAMRAAGCKKIVFSSSATVYGSGNTAPFKENYALSSTNPYGSTKLFIENILRELWISDQEWSISLLRYFNPIGAHESGMIGESPQGIPNNLVPFIAQVAAGIRPELNIFGNDYETPDGTCMRDYLHVVDLAKGHLSALEYISSHTGVEAVNLGTGNGVSVLEIVMAYERACGKKIPYVFAPRRAGDIGFVFADPAKAKSLLGWEAVKTIDEMCTDSWNFMVKNPKGV